MSSHNAPPLAPTIHSAASSALGAELPFGVHAWDGSEHLPESATTTLVLHTPDAVRDIVWHPGELGFARAYVRGSLDVTGDLARALSQIRGLVHAAGSPTRMAVRARAAMIPLLRTLTAHGALRRPPAPPPEEARLSGRIHSPIRDRSAISHHYDLGNDFYELILDDTMAYSCGWWQSNDDEPTITNAARASREKLDLICRKLGLRPGMTLLDVGCGWGSLLVHAATCYGVHATGITLSREQAAYARRRVAETGLADRVTVLTRDYRDLDVGSVDAVASIEMGEHVGPRQYPTYVSTMFGALRPGGRLLLQQMSRDGKAAGGSFIESYIAPDMHMRPIDRTCALMRKAGFEVNDVQSLREHYVLTARAWARNLEDRWSEIAEVAGERTARIWRLYLAGGGLAFAENRMGVDQILAVRPHVDGSSGLPLGRDT